MNASRIILARLLDFVLYTSLFAACCAVGLCVVTEHLFISARPPVLTALNAFVFGATLLVYNAHYLVKKSAPATSDRFRWSATHKPIHYVFLLIGVLLCALSFPRLPAPVLYAFAPLGILSFAYSLPLLPFARKKRLKDFGWLKIIILTTVWTIVTGILPFLAWRLNPADYPYEILLRFSFMLTLCIAFDIRDAQTDLDHGIHTLPNLIGVENSYRLMNATLLLFGALSVGQYLRHPSPERLTTSLLAALAAKLAITCTRRHPSDRAYLGLVDGTMLFYAALTLMY